MTEVILIPNSRLTENVYYDVNFFNSSGGPVPASYTESRDSSILDNSSDYKMSVIRLEADLDMIPMFESFNRTLEITLTYPPDGLSSTASIFPVATTVFNVHTVLNAMNATFSALFLSIVTQFEVIHGVGSWTGDPAKPQLDPFVIYSSPENIFTIYNDVRSESTAPFPVLMFFSLDLALLFSGNLIDVTTGQVLFIFTGGHFNVVNLVAPQTPGQYIFNQQTYPSTEAWYDIDRMVLISSKMPVKKEFVGTRSQDGNNVQTAILTDFDLKFNNSDSNPATKFRYIPIGQFRFIDMIYDGPLHMTDFTLYFTNNEGTLIPIFIRSGGSFNLKVLFTMRTN